MIHCACRHLLHSCFASTQLIFEIRDLRYATPATATRAGILYVREGQQWRSMVESWLRREARCEGKGWLGRPAVPAEAAGVPAQALLHWPAGDKACHSCTAW